MAPHGMFMLSRQRDIICSEMPARVADEHQFLFVAVPATCQNHTLVKKREPQRTLLQKLVGLSNLRYPANMSPRLSIDSGFLCP